MPPFTPGQCLFCPYTSPSFSDSVVHMQKCHGLFIPSQQHLVVDLQTLFQHMHLLIFGFRECIRCGTERASVQAVQQHMTGKGHCTLDLADPDAEFAAFFVSEAEAEADGPQWVDDDAMRLASGRIVAKRTACLPPTPIPQRRRLREQGDGTRETRGSAKRERRERAVATYQATRLCAHDRSSLVHLSRAQQGALLAVQKRQASRGRQETDRRRSRIDRKGNKNLYAYWATETPVYQCG